MPAPPYHAEIDCVHWLPILEPENVASVDELPLLGALVENPPFPRPIGRE